MADEQDPEMIRQQMEMQRAALAAKLETLENKIVETVEGAREAVAETVQTVKEGVRDSVSTVKETVQNSVESVKETFDLRLQVERHPWAMIGGAVAVGFAAGYLLNRAQRAEHPHAWGAAAGLDFRPAGADAVSAPQKPSTTPPPAAARESWGDRRRPRRHPRNVHRAASRANAAAVQRARRQHHGQARRGAGAKADNSAPVRAPRRAPQWRSPRSSGRTPCSA